MRYPITFFLFVSFFSINTSFANSENKKIKPTTAHSLDNAKVINGRLLLRTKHGQYIWAKNGVYKDANGAKISIRNNRISSDTGSHPSGNSFQIIQ